MNNRSFTEDEITEAVITHFTNMGYEVDTKCHIQFGSGKGKRDGEADVVLKNSEGFWLAIIECKSGSIGITEEGRGQLKSYLSATDTRLGILAASKDSDKWKYFENLRSNVFREITDKYSFYKMLKENPRSDRPDAEKINLLNQEKRELVENNDKLINNTRELVDVNSQLEADKVELNNNVNDLEGNISQLETENAETMRKHKLVKLWLILFFVVVPILIGIGISMNYLVLFPTNNEEADEVTYQVTRIIDGDTFEIHYENVYTSVQLIGVDAPEPERSNSPAEYYSTQATKYLQDFLDGELVYFRFDESKFDKYGRILAYVYRVSDNICVNLELIREGYARVDLRYPFKYEELYPKYELRAKEERTGMWRWSSR